MTESKGMKTYKDWLKSRLDLRLFLEVGDVVDEELKMYFIEVLPPACLSRRCIQIGEPYTHDDKGHPMFETLERTKEGWIYTGIKATPPGEVSRYAL